jgi:hypothetical protein
MTSAYSGFLLSAHNSSDTVATRSFLDGRHEMCTNDRELAKINSKLSKRHWILYTNADCVILFSSKFQLRSENCVKTERHTVVRSA